MRMFSCLAVAATLTLATPAAGEADRASHEGAILRIAPGASWAAADDGNIHDVAFDGDVAIGWMPVPNTALHVTIFGSAMPHPGGSSHPLYFYASGVGLTYYLMPQNLYFSGSFGIGQLKYLNTTSENGPALDFAVGKENVSGIGLALGALGYSIEGTYGWGVGVRLSITFN